MSEQTLPPTSNERLPIERVSDNYLQSFLHAISKDDPLAVQQLSTLALQKMLTELIERRSSVETTARVSSEDCPVPEQEYIANMLESSAMWLQGKSTTVWAEEFGHTALMQSYAKFLRDLRQKLGSVQETEPPLCNCGEFCNKSIGSPFTGTCRRTANGLPVKASALPQKYHTTPGTIDGPCIHCSRPFAEHWRDEETYAYMCGARPSQNGSAES